MFELEMVRLVAYNTENGECICCNESKEEAIKTIAEVISSREDFMEGEVKYFFQNNESSSIDIEEDSVEVDEETLLKIQSEIDKLKLR